MLLNSGPVQIVTVSTALVALKLNTLCEITAVTYNSREEGSVLHSEVPFEHNAQDHNRAGGVYNDGKLLLQIEIIAA